MGTEKKFSSKEAINFGWAVAKEQWKFFAVLLIIAGVFIIPLAIMSASLEQDVPLFSTICTIFTQFLQILMGMGAIRVVLNILDDEAIEIKTLFSCYPLFFKYLGAYIVYCLIAGAPMALAGIIGAVFKMPLLTMLFMIIGLPWLMIALIKFQFYGYLIIDKEVGIVESLQISAEITQDAKWDLANFGFWLFGVNVLGLLALGVGLVLSIPTTLIASAYVYRKLLGSASQGYSVT